MADDIIVKVTRLIALASSSNENEARNAAHKACALIREHKLVVSLSKPPATSWPSPSSPSPQAARDPWSATGRRPETNTYKVCKGCLNVRIEWSETYCTLCKISGQDPWSPIDEFMRQVKTESERHHGRPNKRPAKKVKVEYDKVWFVECATCDRKGPNGKTSEEADVKALEYGFRLVEGKPMCPKCVYKYDERTGTKTP